MFSAKRAHVTLEVLQPTPLKRISSQDSKQESEDGKTRLHFVDQKLHDLEYYTTRDLEVHG